MGSNIFYGLGGKLILAGNRLLEYVHTVIIPIVFNDVHTNSKNIVIQKSDGSTYLSGYNPYGQFGNNSTIYQESPIRITKSINKIGSGLEHNSGIDYNGKAWGWGYNNWGQLGVNSTTAYSTPVAVLGTNKTFCQIFAHNHTIALDLRGKAWAWGLNSSGQLGDYTVVSKTTPVSVKGTNKTFCQISAHNHTLSIDFRGKIWAWGSNTYGQLGNYTTASKSTPVALLGVNKTFCQISAGDNHSIALDYAGKAWGWGYNSFGQVGDYSRVCRSTPVAVLGINKTFCQISAGVKQTVALDFRGKAWAWGVNNTGQLGDNSTLEKSTPIAVLGANKTFCHISTGDFLTIAIDNNNNIWGWGQLEYLGVNKMSLNPTKIDGVKKTFCKIDSKYAGERTMLIDNYGKAWGWGLNNIGQIGTNSATSQTTPIAVYGSKTFCQISGGNNHSLAIDLRGKPWGWGYNSFGQVGDYTILQKSTPVAVLGVNKTFCQIMSGLNYSTAINNRGKVWCWGLNGSGQLGINSSVLYSTPVAILGVNKTFCKIVGGGGHTIGIDFRGKIWSWGANTKGQLGNNTTSAKSTPFAILGVNKTFCQITAGSNYSMALDNRGLAWGWGYNLRGQLGVNSAVSYSTPVAVLGALKTFCQIVNGSDFTMALDYTGRVWSWGQNSNGQLGDKTLVNKSTPILVYGSKTFCSITVGVDHSKAIDYTGQVWSWGAIARLGYVLYALTPIRINI